MDVRTICHIFDFIGCGNVDWLIVKGENQLDIIIVNEYRLDESVNQTLLVFLKPQIKIPKLMQREQNEVLGDFRTLIFFSAKMRIGSETYPFFFLPSNL